VNQTTDRQLQTQLLLDTLRMSGSGGYITTSCLVSDDGLRSLRALEPLQEQFLAEHRSAIPVAYAGKWPVDKLHWWSRPEEYAFTLFHLLRLLDSSPTALRVLEFGPGCSFVPHALARVGGLKKLQMVDIDPNVVAFWKTVGPAIGLHVGQPEASVEHAFDVIYSVSVVEHVRDPEAVVRDLVHQLAPGGTLILTMDVDLDPEGRHGLRVTQLANILAVGGVEFEPVPCAAACPHPLDIATPRDGWQVSSLASATPGQRVAPVREPVRALKQAIKQLFQKAPDPRDICAIKLIGKKAR
jgi:2-polyprenyl-3-methyl-5-hydroxy-6-metoxy-1,4-benzoquinol methylase